MARKGNPISIKFLVRISGLSFLIFCMAVCYWISMTLGWMEPFQTAFWKLGLALGGRALSLALLKLGLAGGLAVTIGLLARVLITAASSEMVGPRMMPTGSDAAEQPANVPSGASTSGWRSFEERVLLEPMPSSGESSEASVNQQPGIPELDPPLMEENARRAELSDRLRVNLWGIAYNEQILGSFLHHQLSIERHIEAALVEDGYDPQVVFEKRHKIRGFIFYPNGCALSEDAYARHVTQILNFGTRQSVPYRRVIQAIRNSDLFLER